MNRTTWVSSICIIFCALGVAIGFIAIQREFWAAAIIILGILWIMAFTRRWSLIFNLTFTLFIFLIIYLTFEGFFPALTLILIALALGAWDLNGMLTRFEKLDPEVIDRSLERNHFNRLVIILGAGVVLGWIAMSFRIHFTFWIGLLLALIVFIGICRLILYLRRSNESIS